MAKQCIECSSVNAIEEYIIHKAACSQSPESMEIKRQALEKERDEALAIVAGLKDIVIKQLKGNRKYYAAHRPKSNYPQGIPQQVINETLANIDVCINDIEALLGDKNEKRT